MLAATELPFTLSENSLDLAERFARSDFFIYLSSADNRGVDIIAAKPKKLLFGQKEKFALFEYGECSELRLSPKDYLKLLASSPNGSNPNPAAFSGGLLGYLGYPEKRNGNLNHAEGLLTPHLQVGWYDWAIVLEPSKQKGRVIFHDTCTESERQWVLQTLKNEESPKRFAPHHFPDDKFELTSKFIAEQSKAKYLANLRKINDYIHQGDCYQVNYAQRFAAKYSGDPWLAFRQLCSIAKAPYSAFLRTECGAILSLSPEQFIQVKGSEVRTSPIKGTRKRGESALEDTSLRQELAESPKDRAENLMIVDLLRNDLSLHAQIGSVKVESLFDIQTFENVHHMVSSITAQKDDSVHALDILFDAFPGGSITGAPKRRAMEIINELEPHERSVYCGSIFHCSHRDSLESNIAIRTLLCESGNIYCWGGGGIVADSDPEQEYEESVNKVKLLMDTLESL